MFEQIMSMRPVVDAIFFCNDDLAQGALLAALRMGLRVPETVAVVGFNDLRGSDQMVPPLTTIRTPRTGDRHRGRAAAAATRSGRGADAPAHRRGLRADGARQQLSRRENPSAG